MGEGSSQSSDAEVKPISSNTTAIAVNNVVKIFG